MLTIDSLRRLGADTEQGLGRCMNNEAFYLRLVNMALDDASFEKLSAAAERGDMDAAFEAAHALKGVLGNLALTPLYEASSELTELLRTKTGADCSALLDRLMKLRAELIAERDS